MAQCDFFVIGSTTIPQTSACAAEAFCNINLEHLRIKISDMKSEQRFDDFMSSLLSSKYMIELIIYIYIYIYSSSGVKICRELKRELKHSIVM